MLLYKEVKGFVSSSSFVLVTPCCYVTVPGKQSGCWFSVCRQLSTEMIKRHKARRQSIDYVFPVYFNDSDTSDISSNWFSEPINKNHLEVHFTGRLKLSGQADVF